MTFLAPGWLALGTAGALALVALHLLAIGRPPSFALPTARFVPLRAARARRLARRPTDLLLLAMRALVMLLAGAALARPVRTPTRRPIARIIVADRSLAVRDLGAVRDSVRAIATAGDLLVAFDSAAATAVALGTTPAARDSVFSVSVAPAFAGVASNERGAASGSLSAALAAARRAAPQLRDAADSIELVVVSPLTSAERDAATTTLRAAWGGRVRVARVAAAEARPAPSTIRVTWRGAPALPDDALAAAATLAMRSNRPPRVDSLSRHSAADTNIRVGVSPIAARIARDGITAADSAWAHDSGGVLLDWPIDAVPASWTRRARVDTVGAVVAGGSAFVAPMPRRARYADVATVAARWADGEPAAVEHANGAGCVRTVAVPVPQIGDAALRPPFLALLRALTAPCAGRATGTALDDAYVTQLVGTGPLLATRSLGTSTAPRDPLARWLLGLAIALLVLELPLRLLQKKRIDDAPVASETAPDVEAAA